MTKNTLRPSTLILTCLSAFVLVSLAACADDERLTSTNEASATTLSTDSKDMSHRHDHSSH